MEPLVSQAERRWAEGGLLALLLLLAVRVIVLYALTRSPGLTPLHYIVAGTLVAALNFGGLLLPRSVGGVLIPLGVLGWLAAISLLPWPFRMLYPPRVGELWLVWLAVGLALASFALRFVLQRRWRGQLAGHGYAWIENWAREKPLRARMLARRVLIALGYERAKQL